MPLPAVSVLHVPHLPPLTPPFLPSVFKTFGRDNLTRTLVVISAGKITRRRTIAAFLEYSGAKARGRAQSKMKKDMFLFQNALIETLRSKGETKELHRVFVVFLSILKRCTLQVL